MTLHYSLGDIAPQLYDIDLPYRDMSMKRIRVRIDSPTFTFSGVGQILSHHRSTERKCGITLLLEYQMGTVPPSSEPIPMGVWTDVPGAAKIQQIRVPLTDDAIAAIKKVENSDHDYEIELHPEEMIRV